MKWSKQMKKKKDKSKHCITNQFWINEGNGEYYLFIHVGVKAWLGNSLLIFWNFSLTLTKTFAF